MIHPPIRVGVMRMNGRLDGQLLKHEPVGIAEGLVAGGHHPLARLEAAEDLEMGGILPAELDESPRGVIARWIHHENPVAAGGLVESAPRDHHGFGRIAHLEAEAQRLPAADPVGCIPDELEIHLEATLADLRIDAGSNELVLASGDFTLRPLVAHHARNVELVDLRAHAIAVEYIDLSEARAGTANLSDLRIQHGQLPIDGCLHDEVLEIILDDVEVALHAVECVLHLRDLLDHPQGVLPESLQREVLSVLPVFVFIPHAFEFPLGDQPLLVQLLEAVVLLAQPLDVVVHLGELLAEIERVHLHVEAGVLQAISLLDALRLRIEQAKLQVVVGEAEDGLPGRDVRPFADEHFLDAPALDGVQIDGRARKHRAGYGDELLKRAFRDEADGDLLLVDVEPLAAGAGGDGVADQRHEEDGAADQSDTLRRPPLLLELPVDALARSGSVRGSRAASFNVGGQGELKVERATCNLQRAT